MDMVESPASEKRFELSEQSDDDSNNDNESTKDDHQAVRVTRISGNCLQKSDVKFTPIPRRQVCNFRPRTMLSQDRPQNSQLLQDMYSRWSKQSREGQVRLLQDACSLADMSQDFSEKFKIGKQIHACTLGMVYLCQHEESRVSCAALIIQKLALMEITDE